jgi:hypothetical protein
LPSLAPPLLLGGAQPATWLGFGITIPERSVSQCIEGMRWVVPGTKSDKEPAGNDLLQFRKYAERVLRRGRLNLTLTDVLHC